MASPADLFRRLTNGVYVITAAHGGTTGAFTAAWVTQVSFEPLLLAVSINPANATWPLIQQSRRCVVNVLAAGQLELARHLGTQSGRDLPKLRTVRTAPSEEGTIVLADTIAWLDCRVEQEVAAGDHIVVLARVMTGDVLDRAAAPMRYSETGDMDGASALYPSRF